MMGPTIIRRAAGAAGERMETPPHKPLTMRELWRELVDELFSLDRGLPWTFVQLWRRPGATIRGYVAARDPRVTRPIRYLVIATAALTGAMLLLRSRFEAMGRIESGTQAAAIADLAIENLLLVSAVGVVASALVMWLVFRRERPALVETTVVAAYIGAQSTWLNVVSGFAVAAAGSPWSSVVVAIVIVGYTVWAWGDYFGGRAGDWLRAFAGIVLTQAVTGALVFAAARLATAG